MTNPLDHNRAAWDRQVELGNKWTVPASPELIDRARRGDVEIVLTPIIRVPNDWLGELPGRDVLCLASGGGQQGPILAAAGATVTVFDNSPKQLARDEEVAEREGLSIQTVLGDMADLSCFDDESFELIVHPCSNAFAENILPVWKEAARVLEPGGVLIAGMTNPIRYLYDEDRMERGEFELEHSIPYSDKDALSAEEISARAEKGGALEFGHTLDDQIGGQIAAGLTITGFYEDKFDSREDPISQYIATFFATRAVK